MQRVEFGFEVRRESEVRIAYDEGSDVYIPSEPPAPGARSDRLRVLRSHAEPGALRLLLEGRGGHAYTLQLKTPFAVGDGPGFSASRSGADEYRVTVAFDSPTDGYVRREVVIPLKKR